MKKMIPLLKILGFSLAFFLLVSCGRKAPPLPIEKSIPQVPGISAEVESQAIKLLIDLPSQTSGGSYLTSLKALIIEKREVFLDDPKKKEKETNIKLKPRLHSAATLFIYTDEKVAPRRLYIYRVKAKKDFLVESPFSEEVRIYFRYPPKAPVNLKVIEVYPAYYLLRFEPVYEDIKGLPLELPLEFTLERIRDGKSSYIDLKNKTEYTFTKEGEQKECFRVQARFRYFTTEIKGPLSRELCF
jgi:hypothetical protein